MKLSFFFSLLVLTAAHPNHSWSTNNLSAEATVTPEPSSPPPLQIPPLPSPPALRSCPAVIPLPRIVGGSQTPELTPYLIALFDGQGFFRCSGTLVNARWVITAAHCRVTTAWIVVLGGKVANQGTPRRIAKVINHPRYGIPTQNENDIAAVQLTEDAPAGSKFALVNDDDNLPREKSYAKAAGYGLTQEGGSTNGELRSVDLPVVSQAVCRWAYSSLLTDNMICAGSAGCDACQGDSGGPLLQFARDGRAVLVGVVSFGFGCGRPNYPGVFADSARYVTWLKNVGVEFAIGNGVQIFA